jgi:long-chain fatty acid transport protein
MRKFTGLLLLMVFAAATTFGGGYQVGLHGAKNIGMGLIGTSLSYDASTYFYNPAGGVFIKDRFSFSGGVTLLMSRTTYQATDMLYQTSIQHKLNTPFYLYAAFKPYEDLSIGLAVNTPYGNKLAWEKDWKGRYLIQDIAFKAITIQPSFSYKFHDMFSAGIGIVFATGNVEMNKAIPLDSAGGEGQLNITGNAFNVGVNFGIMVKPVKGLSLGLDYRSKINMFVDNGDATFIVPGSLQSNFPKYNQVAVNLPLPANLDFGASYEIGEKWMVGLNLCYVFWGTYDSLKFQFSTKTPAVNTSTSPTLYKNKLITRLGVQYNVSKVITVRAGGYYDPSPVPDDYLNPQTPSANQIGMTFGASIVPVKNLSIDLSFLYVMGMQREGKYVPDNFSGIYKTNAYAPGFGLTYNF